MENNKMVTKLNFEKFLKYDPNGNKNWIESTSTTRRSFLKIGGMISVPIIAGGGVVIAYKPARDSVVNFFESLADSKNANGEYIKAVKLGDTIYVISKESKIIYEITPLDAGLSDGYASLVSRINPNYNRARIHEVANLAQQINCNPRISTLEDGLPISIEKLDTRYTGLNLGVTYLIPKELRPNEIKNRKLEWLLE